MLYNNGLITINILLISNINVQFNCWNIVVFACSPSAWLNSAILLNLHVNSQNFMFIGFPIYKIMASLSEDSFISSFSNAYIFA